MNLAVRHTCAIRTYFIIAKLIAKNEIVLLMFWYREKIGHQDNFGEKVTDLPHEVFDRRSTFSELKTGASQYSSLHYFTFCLSSLEELQCSRSD